MVDDARIQSHLDGLTKPPGSLGQLERLAHDLCRIQGTLQPETRPRRLVLFAGDHGVVASGVSSWPSEVTAAMVTNIATGGAASSVFARTHDCDLVLVDAGCQGTTDQPANAIHPIQRERIASGSADLSREPALTTQQLEASLELGRRHAADCARDGMRVVLAGEMGIGNSTPASCLSSLLTNLSATEAVGRGAGADDELLQRKTRIVHAAVERERANDRTAAIAALAGFEIAAMAGFYLGAHQAGLTILLDGQIATSAALIAQHFEPGVSRSMIAAHRSVEPAHVHILGHLGLEPYLDWNLRLGEGTGALLLLPLLDAAAAMTREMATLEDLLSS